MRTRIMRVSLAGVAALAWTATCLPALARMPRVYDAHPWIAADQTEYQIGIHCGDGVIGPDPCRPVVLRGDNIVAQGRVERRHSAFVQCSSPQRCCVLTGLRALEPDPAHFQSGPHFREVDPTGSEDTFGFTERRATALEMAIYLRLWISANSDLLIFALVLMTIGFAMERIGGMALASTRTMGDRWGWGLALVILMSGPFFIGWIMAFLTDFWPMMLMPLAGIALAFAWRHMRPARRPAAPSSDG